jgi:hypothetical protein
MYCSFECKKRHPNPPQIGELSAINNKPASQPAAGEANFSAAGVGKEKKYEV